MHTVGTTVLIVDDDASARRLLQVRLRALGCTPLMAADGKEALDLLRRDVPAVMLLDLEMPRMGGLELLRELRLAGIDVPTIVITAHGSIEAAVEAMKAGSYDFLLKPFDPDHLEIVVRKTLERRQLLDANRLLRETLAARTPDILGESPAIRRAMDTAKKAAASNATILLLGESGTGKEVFAHAIHATGFRVRLLKKPRYVVEADCIGCSLCELACDVYVPHEFDYQLGARRAIYIPHANAIPQVAVLDPEHCVFDGACAKVCPKDCIDFAQLPEECTVEVGTVIVASGLHITPMNAKKEYGGDRYANVMNPLAMERVQ